MSRDFRAALVLPILVLGFAAGLATGCAPASTLEPVVAPDAEREAPARLETVLFESYTRGVRDIALRAASAQVDPVTLIAKLHDVKISFRDAQRGDISVSAETARLDLSTEDFELNGGVKGSTGKGERFETEQVRFDAKNQKLRSDHPVRVHRPNLTLAGDGMVIDVPTRRVKIEGRVRTVLRPR